MSKRKFECPRCEALERPSGKGENRMIGPNGVLTSVCDVCLDEIDEEQEFNYEIKENEEPLGDVGEEI